MAVHETALPCLFCVVCVVFPGKEVTVTVLGGSISTGAVASRKQAKENPNDVWSLVRLYMQKNINGELVFNNNAR